jgi:hypothetical protein
MGGVLDGGEACPNHTYPIRHKLKDYGMIRSFMMAFEVVCRWPRLTLVIACGGQGAPHVGAAHLTVIASVMVVVS